MTTPIVKKSQMGRAQWSAFVSTLKQIDARTAAKILKDNVVTDKEMNALLDRNADGKVTYQDFGSFTHPLFRDIKRFLYAYNFSAYRLWKPTTGNLPSVPFQFWSDEDFVEAAIRYDRRLLKYASKDVALAMVSWKPALLSHIKPSFRQDRDFVIAAVKKNYRVLEYAGALRKDKAFLLSIAKECRFVLKYADASLTKDKAFALAVLRRMGRFSFWDDTLPPSLRRDKAFILDALKAIPNMLLSLRMVDPALLKNRDVIRQYILGQRILLLPKGKLSMWLSIWLRRWWRVSGLDAFFTKKDCKDDATALAALWKLVREDSDLKKFFTAKELANRASFFAALKKKHNISFPSRLRSLTTIIKVLKNRATTHVLKDARPLCVIVGPTKDKDGAFVSAHAEEMIGFGYRVIYYEATVEDDVKKALKSATVNGYYRAKVIVLAGHGNRLLLALGGKNPRRLCTSCGALHVDERYFIDVSDFRKKDEFQLARYIAHDGDIVLDACSTGKGGASNPRNLANMVARTLYEGVTVHSPLKNTILGTVELKDKKLVATWPGCATYKVRGSKPSLLRRLLKRAIVKPRPIVRSRRKVASSSDAKRFYPFSSKLFRIEVRTKHKPEPNRPAASPRVVPKRPADTDTDVEF